MVVRRTVRWAATHGAMRLAIRARARAGNPDAEVLSDPVVAVQTAPPGPSGRRRR